MTMAQRKRKFEADDMHPNIIPHLSRPSAPSKLCSRCAKIDLDSLLSRTHQNFVGKAAENLGSVRDWDIESCHFCSLLYSTIDMNMRESASISLRTFSSNKMNDKFWGSLNKNMLLAEHSGRYIDSEPAGTPGRFIIPQPEGTAGPVKLIKETIDSFDHVKSWITLCKRKHTKNCSIPMENRSSVPGLRLIDCDTRTIVPNGFHLYVALSYVWGDGSETPEYAADEDLNKLPKTLPATIEDAITVTKKLGYHYIWIDRYCICQKDEKMKADQVGKMDVIYRNAELTIIAAIGEDPNYGLPGVGQRKRESQYLTTSAQIGKHFFISIDAWPKGVIANTKWRTRAWTYQEALLSRRRLVFAKQQMYFECYGMYCCESLDFSLESRHRKDMQAFKNEFFSKDRVGLFPKGVGVTTDDIVLRIEEYSKLNLTEPSDILKGMLGIFNAFRKNHLRVCHCAGIPILPLISQKKPIEWWAQSTGLFRGLFWDLKMRSERRHGFPSWSWTGWYGPVKWGGFDESWVPIHVDCDVEVRVELLDKRILTLKSFQALHSQSNIYTQLSNTLHITAWTVEAKIIHCRRETGKDKYTVRLELEDGGHLHWSFKSASRGRFSPGKLCKGIILGHQKSRPEERIAILICSKIGDSLERIGIGWVDRTWYFRYNKDGNMEGKENTLGPLELVKSWEDIQIT